MRKIVTTPNGPEEIIVDSSGWIEFLGDGPKADRFAPYLQSQTATLLLPVIIFYEVYKKIIRERGKGEADNFRSLADGFDDRLIPLTLDLAVSASAVSIEFHLPMADAMIYAVVEKRGARLITSDAHFANLPRVTLV